MADKFDALKKIKWQDIHASLPAELRNPGEDISLLAKKVEKICQLVHEYHEKAKPYLSYNEALFLNKEWRFYVEHTLDAYLRAEDPPKEGLIWMEGYLCGFVGMVRAILVDN